MSFLRKWWPRTSTASTSRVDLDDTSADLARSDWWVVISVALLVGFIVSLGELVPWMLAANGEVWTPFSSPNYRVGDTPYYASFVREALELSVPVGSPTAGGVTLSETLKSVPIYFAALPGLVLSDFRFVMLVTLAVWPAIKVVAVTAIAVRLIGRTRAALMAGLFAGVTATLLHPVWALLPNAPGLSPRSWFRFAFDSIRSFPKALNQLADFVDYEVYSDSFRLVNMSVSGVLLLLFLLVVIWSLRRPSLWKGLALVTAGVALAYSYSSHLVVGGLVLMAFTAFAVYEKRWEVVRAGLLAGSAIIVVLLVLGYPAALTESFQNTPVTSGYTFSSLGLRGGVFETVFVGLVNKYTLASAVVVALSWKRSVLRRWVVSVAGSAVVFSFLLNLDDPNMSSRFLQRGADYVFFPILLIVVAWLLVEAWGKARVRRPALSRAVAIGLAGILLVVPAFSITAYGVRAADAGSHAMPAERWEMLGWLDANTEPDAVVLAFDWEAISHIPVYSDADLYAGPGELSGRPPADEMDTFLRGMAWCGIDREWVRDLAVESPWAESARRSTFATSEPPWLSEDDFDAARFFGGVVYYPYTQALYGLDLVDSQGDETGPAVNPAVVDELLRRFDGFAAGPPPQGIDYLVISDRYTSRGSFDCLTGYELEFSNSTYSVYGRP